MTEILNIKTKCNIWHERLMSKTDVSHSQIEDFCRRWNIVELCVFGSLLRDDFGPSSDVDFLFQHDPNCEYSFQDLLDMVGELEETFDRKVDFVDRMAIENSRNYLRRDWILETMEVVYEAGR